MTFALGNEGIEFEFVYPDEFGLPDFPPEEPQMSAITDIFPMKRFIRIPVEGLPSREQLTSLGRGIRITG